MQKHILTKHEAACICEMNRNYDSDFNSDTARPTRIATMIAYANMSRAERRARFVPSPFDALDERMLGIALAGGIRTLEEWGVDDAAIQFSAPRPSMHSGETFTDN